MSIESDYYAKNLHWPAREDHLESLEQHLMKASQLSRALWVALSNEGHSCEDERSRLALEQLASTVADHASAALFMFNMNSHSSGEA